MPRSLPGSTVCGAARRGKLDPSRQVGHNRRKVKTLCLVLFVCLTVQLNATSASFLHLHAGAAPETDDHDDSVVHRHLAPHTPETSHHHDAQVAPKPELDGESIAIESSDATEPLAVGALTARVSSAGTSIAVPAGVATVIRVARPALPPNADVGASLPDSLDPRSSSHRGPPR